jgi:hypothetical protein
MREAATIDRLNYNELTDRSLELTNCQSASHNAGYGSEKELLYANAYAIYATTIAKRMAHYIDRHGESQQFQNEDAAGQR